MEAAPFRTWVRGGAQPVLALHCSLAHAGEWSGLAAGLEGVTLTAPDQPGHGRAAPWQGAGDFHGEATGQALALAESLGAAGKIDLLGHSFGGTVALRLALARPDLWRSLVLIEPVLFAAARGTAEFAEFERRHEGVAEALVQGAPELALRRFLADWGDGQAFEALPERSRRYMVERMGLIGLQTEVLVQDTAGILRPGGLEGLELPVLLLRGGLSPPVVPAIQARLLARLPRAREEVLAGAGHMLPVTQAAEVAKRLMPFWAGC